MKKTVCKLCALLVTLSLFSACGRAPLSGDEATRNAATAQMLAAGTSPAALTPAADSSLPDAVFGSYYAGQSDPAFEYFQRSKIQKFLAMWVKEETGDIANPEWNYDSFTEISVLDHTFEVSRPDEKLFCCTFSDGVDRYGYAIVAYDKSGPSLSNWSVTETTPTLFDLKAYEKEIAVSLRKTDIDLSTAKASRVYLLDRENNRADQVIRFTDGKGDNYIGYFGSAPFAIEKWQIPKTKSP